MSDTVDINVFIEELRILSCNAKDNKAVGRYQGWALCFRGAAWQWIKENYDQAKTTLAQHGIQLLRWSSLSFDSDDKDDFALRMDIQSV